MVSSSEDRGIMSPSYEDRWVTLSNRGDWEVTINVCFHRSERWIIDKSLFSSLLENGCNIDYFCNKNEEILEYLTVSVHKTQFAVEGQNPTITQLIEYID